VTDAADRDLPLFWAMPGAPKAAGGTTAYGTEAMSTVYDRLRG
jgi:hypothetical protein